MLFGAAIVIFGCLASPVVGLMRALRDPKAMLELVTALLLFPHEGWFTSFPQTVIRITLVGALISVTLGGAFVLLSAAVALRGEGKEI